MEVYLFLGVWSAVSIAIFAVYTSYFHHTIITQYNEMNQYTRKLQGSLLLLSQETPAGIKAGLELLKDPRLDNPIFQPAPEETESKQEPETTEPPRVVIQ